MWSYLKKVNAKDKERPVCRGRTLWIAASRTPADRKKGRHLRASKDVLVEVGLAKEEEVDFDPKRGILWIGRQRVAEWNEADERCHWDSEKLKAAGVAIESQNLDDAVADKLRSS